MALNYSLLVEKFTTITTNTNINWSDGFNVSHFDDTYKEQYTKIKLSGDTGTFSFAKETECCILVVGGGGSGASGANGGGGGGGGGVSYYDSVILPADTYDLIVGAGGSDGKDGTNSSFIGRKTSSQISIISTGGEGAKGLLGGNSGSGKLRDYNGIVTDNVSHSAFIPSSNNPYIANKLGFGGGGAYASSPNIISGSYIGGNGGKGYSVHNTYDGTRKIYGAGGGGSSISGTSGAGGDGESNTDGTSNGAGNGAGNNTSVSNGLANTGGGGGGGGGGAGGSGIIIIFFKTSNINTLKPTLSSFARSTIPQSSNSSKKQSCVKDKDCEYIGCGQNEIGATSHCEYETCYKQNLQGKLILCPKHGDDTDVDDNGKGYQYGYYDDPDYNYGYGVDATAAATTTISTIQKHNLSFKDDIVDSGTTDDKKMSTIGIIVMVLIIILIILWVIAGLCGFIMSLICFSKEGDFIFNILGLILALLVGPFYWIFYAYNKKYCN